MGILVPGLQTRNHGLRVSHGWYLTQPGNQPLLRPERGGGREPRPRDSLCRQNRPEAAPGCGQCSGPRPSVRGASEEPASASVGKGVRAVRAGAGRLPPHRPGQRTAGCQGGHSAPPSHPPQGNVANASKTHTKPLACLHRLEVGKTAMRHCPRTKGLARGHGARVPGAPATEPTAVGGPEQGLAKADVQSPSAPSPLWASVSSARTLLHETVARIQGGDEG